MKFDSSKSLAEAIKEVAVSIASILVILGSIAQGLSNFSLPTSPPKTAIEASIKKELRKAYHDLPREFNGIFLWRYDDEGKYRYYMAHVSDAKIDTRSFEVRDLRSPSAKKPYEVQKNNECHKILTKDIPDGDPALPEIIEQGIQGIMYCPVIIDGTLKGSLSVAWTGKTNIVEAERALRRLSARLEDYLK